MRALPLSLLLLALPAAAGDGPAPLTLENAVNLALERNRDLARSRTLLGRNQQGLRAAEAEFSFSFRPEGTAGAGDSESRVQYGLAATRAFRTGTEVQLRGSAGIREPQDDDEETTETDAETSTADTLYNGRATIQVTQPVFRNFGRLVNEEGIATARDNLRTARRALEQETASTLLSVTETFVTCIRLERQIAADEAFLARMGQLLTLTATRERQGKATRVDRMRVDLQKGQAGTRLTQSRERLQQVRLDLAELTGQDASTLPALTPPPEFRIELPDPAQAVAVAYSNRLDYAQAIDNHTRAQRLSQITRRSLWPDLAIVSRYGKNDEGPSASDALNFGEDEWFVGLAAGRELNPARERAQLASAEVDVDATLQSVRISEVRIARLVRQRISGYRTALAEVDIAQENLNLARRRTDLARRLFKAGRGDAFSVSDSEDALQTAEVAWIDAQAALVVAGFRLMNEMGSLHAVPDDLKPKGAP